MLQSRKQNNIKPIQLISFDNDKSTYCRLLRAIALLISYQFISKIRSRIIAYCDCRWEI